MHLLPKQSLYVAEEPCLPHSVQTFHYISYWKDVVSYDLILKEKIKLLPQTEDTKFFPQRAREQKVQGL